METVTFVYALATEQERQTEALKNQKKNQLERYRHIIQRQMEKERAFLSFKKVEFLSRQKTKFERTRSFSARARITESLPEIMTKGHAIAKNDGCLALRNPTLFLCRQRTHFGTKLVSSKTHINNSSPEETKKSCPSIVQTRTNNSCTRVRTNDLKLLKSVHFERETQLGTRPVPQKLVATVTDSRRNIENETLGKEGSTLPKYDSIKHQATDTKRKKLSEDSSYQGKESTVEPSNKSRFLHGVESADESATKVANGQVSWAVVARLVGLQTKFKRRRINGKFQAPELEVLDPTLQNERRVCQETPTDPFQEVRGCRYLRMPNKK